MDRPARNGAAGNKRRPAFCRGRLVDAVDDVVRGADGVAEEQDVAIGIDKRLDGCSGVAVENAGIASRRSESRVSVRFSRALSVLIQREVPLHIVPLRFEGVGRQSGDYRCGESASNNDFGPGIHCCFGVREI